MSHYNHLSYFKMQTIKKVISAFGQKKFTCLDVGMQVAVDVGREVIFTDTKKCD